MVCHMCHGLRHVSSTYTTCLEPCLDLVLCRVFVFDVVYDFLNNRHAQAVVTHVFVCLFWLCLGCTSCCNSHITVFALCSVSFIKYVGVWMEIFVSTWLVTPAQCTQYQDLAQILQGLYHSLPRQHQFM